MKKILIKKTKKIKMNSNFNEKLIMDKIFIKDDNKRKYNIFSSK